MNKYQADQLERLDYLVEPILRLGYVVIENSRTHLKVYCIGLDKVEYLNKLKLGNLLEVISPLTKEQLEALIREKK